MSIFSKKELDTLLLYRLYNYKIQIKGLKGTKSIRY